MTEPSYEEADAVLAAVDKQLQLLRKSEDLPGDPWIERWRWDEPGITLTWLEEIGEAEYIGKNIHAQIVGDHVDVEINAWSDKDIETTRKRYWEHSYVNKFKVPLNEKEVHDVLWDAYSKISPWTFKSLSNETILPPMNHV